MHKIYLAKSLIYRKNISKSQGWCIGNKRNLTQAFELNHLLKWSHYNNKKQKGQKLYIIFILHEMGATANENNEMRGLVINVKDVKIAYAQR